MCGKASRGHPARFIVTTIARRARFAIGRTRNESGSVGVYSLTHDVQDGTIMSSLTVTDEQVSATPAKVIQPAWVRIMHWINAFAMILMILSGWQIYNASPLFGFSFPREYTLGGWLGGGLLWHFAAMWLLMINGLAYLIPGFATGRFRKKLLPITPAGVLHDVRAALTFK